MAGRRKKATHDPQALEMIQLQALGYRNDDIAKMYDITEETVSRKTSAEKKRLRVMADKLREQGIEPTQIANIYANNENPQQKSLAIRGGEISNLIPKKGSQNPFASLNDFSEIARHSVAAATVPGSAIAHILEGFNDDGTRSAEERCEMAMKGGASLFGFIFGLVETGRALSPESRAQQKQIKIVHNEELDE